MANSQKSLLIVINIFFGRLCNCNVNAWAFTGSKAHVIEFLLLLDTALFARSSRHCEDRYKKYHLIVLIKKRVIWIGRVFLFWRAHMVFFKILVMFILISEAVNWIQSTKLRQHFQPIIGHSYTTLISPFAFLVLVDTVISELSPPPIVEAITNNTCSDTKTKKDWDIRSSNSKNE